MAKFNVTRWETWDVKVRLKGIEADSPEQAEQKAREQSSHRVTK